MGPAARERTFTGGACRRRIETQGEAQLVPELLGELPRLQASAAIRAYIHQVMVGERT